VVAQLGASSCSSVPPRLREGCEAAVRLASEGASLEDFDFEEVSEALRFISIASRARDGRLRELARALDERVSAKITSDAIVRLLSRRAVPQG